jgi:hypothetical protein
MPRRLLCLLSIAVLVAAAGSCSRKSAEDIGVGVGPGTTEGRPGLTLVPRDDRGTTTTTRGDEPPADSDLVAYCDAMEFFPQLSELTEDQDFAEVRETLLDYEPDLFDALDRAIEAAPEEIVIDLIDAENFFVEFYAVLSEVEDEAEFEAMLAEQSAEVDEAFLDVEEFTMDNCGFGLG